MDRTAEATLVSERAGVEPAAVNVTAPHVLREYALLADGERGALVGPRGEIAWMCVPRWDGDAVFSALIGGGGVYAVTPLDRHVWGGHYEPGTLIWRSRWVTDDAIVECHEALALPARPDRAVILRRLVGLEGTARIRILLRPRAAHGHEPLRAPTRGDDGVWRARTGDLRVTLAGAADAGPREDGDGGGQALVLDLDIAAGDRRDLVLALDAPGAGGDLPTAEAAWAATETGWRERVPALEDTVAPRDARHAYAVLAGLTSAGGGMVAAATTSLPERARQGRNYDYRYVWIRDQSYAGQAVAADGPHPLMDDAVRFVRDRLLADGEDLKPAYTITGGDVPEERRLDLPGYPGGADVVGNRVRGQFQLDAFGEALLLFGAAARHDHLDADAWRAAEAAAAAIERRWRQPDAGIWEIDPAPWTHSRLICAAGLRRIAAHAPHPEQAAGWLVLAERLVADTSAHAVHRSGRWQRAPDDERVDAALLLAAIRGAIPADDPRTIATLRAVERELSEDGYLYRYRPDERPLGQSEGAFLVCGFWMALAHDQQGEQFGAARWFERNRAACGTPGLFSEEFDVAQRQLRGNLPQAFVHALLLECAAALAGGR